MVQVRPAPGEAAFEFLHPRCALDRSEDLEEVEQMIEGGEVDIATDELRWLLNGCPDLIAAHRYLGELALAAEDVSLARGHFGYAYHAGLTAWKKAGYPAPLPYRLAANEPFFAAGQGLVQCLLELNERRLAEETGQVLLRADPTDPLRIRDILAGKTPPACGSPSPADALVTLDIPSLRPKHGETARETPPRNDPPEPPAPS